MKLVYVAGPFRGPNPWEVEQNVRRAETLALEVWRSGAAALCPHANTRFFDKAGDDKVFLEGTMEMLRRCNGMVLVPGWEKSSGTKAEIREALEKHIPIYKSVTELRQHVEGKAYFTFEAHDFHGKL